jgi:hypothetical protein
MLYTLLLSVIFQINTILYAEKSKKSAIVYRRHRHSPRTQQLHSHDLKVKLPGLARTGYIHFRTFQALNFDGKIQDFQDGVGILIIGYASYEKCS